MCKKFGLLYREQKPHKQKEVMKLFYQHEAPSDKMVTYLNPMCNIGQQTKEGHQVRLIIEGDLNKYEFQTYAPATDIITVKTHWNSVLNDKDARYAAFNVNNFYICSVLTSSEYARMHIN